MDDLEWKIDDLKLQVSESMRNMNDNVNGLRKKIDQLQHQVSLLQQKEDENGNLVRGQVRKVELLHNQIAKLNQRIAALEICVANMQFKMIQLVNHHAEEIIQ